MAKYADLMPRRIIRKHRAQLVAMSIGLVLSGCLWGQAGRPDKPAQAAPSGTNQETNKSTEAGAAPAEPHDDTFIIGVDDVLGVSGWKEAEGCGAGTVDADGHMKL